MEHTGGANEATRKLTSSAPGVETSNRTAEPPGAGWQPAAVRKPQTGRETRGARRAADDEHDLKANARAVKQQRRNEQQQEQQTTLPPEVQSPSYLRTKPRATRTRTVREGRLVNKAACWSQRNRSHDLTTRPDTSTNQRSKHRSTPSPPHSKTPHKQRGVLVAAEPGYTP